MRKISLLIIIASLFYFKSNAQTLNTKNEALSFYTFFIDSILFSRTHANTIIVTQAYSTERLNEILNSHSVTFWNNLKMYFENETPKSLENRINNLPGLNTTGIKSYERNGRKVIIIDSVTGQYYTSLSKISRENSFASIFEISKAVFTKDSRFCIIFFHLIHNEGAEMVFKKSEGKWVTDKNNVLWIE